MKVTSKSIRTKDFFSLAFIETCQKGWTEYSGNSYAYISQKKTWDNAESYCKAKGGHLASIMSKRENDFVYGLTPGRGRDYWIGEFEYDYSGNYCQYLRIWSRLNGSQIFRKN